MAICSLRLCSGLSSICLTLLLPLLSAILASMVTSSVACLASLSLWLPQRLCDHTDASRCACAWCVYSISQNFSDSAYPLCHTGQSLSRQHPQDNLCWTARSQNDSKTNDGERSAWTSEREEDH